MKRILLSALVLTFCLLASAEEISEQQALKIAQAFLKGREFVAPPAQESRRLHKVTKDEVEQSFYVFNASGHSGFVVVAADDRMPTVLGYSERGSLNLNSLPCNVKWLLDHYNKVSAHLKASDSQCAVRRESKPEVMPMITTQWDQGAPYNTFCPVVNDVHCVTGCMATAMAQVINYNRWPQGMTNAVPGYISERIGVEMPELDATQFNWDNMTNDDVAILMLYCGQSVQMDYGLDVSGAFPDMEASALTNVFGYSQTAHLAQHNSYSDEEWEALLYNELAEQRPIVFNGYGGGQGHTFVVHGYRDGFFYINWGWSGQEDGYFILTGLDTQMGSFNNDQTATIGIQPPTYDRPGRPKVVVRDIWSNSGKFVRRNSDGEFMDIWVMGNLVSDLPEQQAMQIGLGLYTDDGLQAVLWEEEHEFPVGETYQFDATFTIGKEIANGAYRIVAISKAPTDEEWMSDANSSDYYLEISIDDEFMKQRRFPLSPEERQTIDEGIVSIDGILYNLGSVNSKKCAMLLSIDHEQFKGDIYIPDAIEYQGEQYRIIGAADGCGGVFWMCDQLTSLSTSMETFPGIGVCDQLRKVELREGVTKMDINAITSCREIESVEFPKSLSLLWQGAECCEKLRTMRFKNPRQFSFTNTPDWNSSSLPALTDVYFASPDAPKINYMSQEIPVNPNVTLHIPEGSKASYEQAGWSGWKIVEDQSVPEMEGIEWGYCIGDDTADWGMGFDGGNNNVECAIRVPSEMMVPYQGKTISSIRIYRAFEPFDYVFITKPDTDYLVKIPYEGAQESWANIDLPEPYEITGEDLYVGVGKANTNVVFMANEESKSSDGFWLRYMGTDNTDWMEPGTWQNLSEEFGYYSVPIRFLISGSDLPEDLWVKDISVEPDKEKITVHAELVSRTKDPIKNYTINWSVDGKESGNHEVETVLYSGHSEKIDFDIPLQLTGVNHEFSYSVLDINGKPDGLETNSKGTIQFKTIANTFYPRKIVMEEGTGTWCGWCVRGIETIERLSKDYPDNFIAIALHTDDDMKNPENYKEIVDKFNSFPGCLINRTTKGDPDYPQIIPLIEEMKDRAEAKITASVNYASADSSSVSVTTKTVFGFTDDESPDYRIAYVVVEDSVGPYLQKNYYSGGTPDAQSEYMSEWMKKEANVRIEFNDVARGIYGGTNGLEGSLPKSIKEGENYQYTYIFKLPSNIQDRKNISIVTLLIDNRSGTIVNADKCGFSILKGDCNGDRTVNAADIVEVVNYIMGKPSSKFHESAADLNGDGVINAADIVLIVNIIMGA